MNGIGLGLPRYGGKGTSIVKPDTPGVPRAQYSLLRLAANSQNAIKVRRSSDNAEKIVGFLPGLPTNRTNSIVQNGNFRLVDSNGKPYCITCTGATCTAANGIMTVQGNGTSEKIGVYFRPIFADTTGRRAYFRSTTKTERRNLLHIQAGTYILNGVTAVVSNGGMITLNGTATAAGNVFNQSLINTIQFDGISNYTFSANVSGIGGPIDASYLISRTDGGSVGTVLMEVTSTSNSTEVYPSGTTSSIAIRANAGTVFSNYIVKLQVEKNNTATEWDQWRATPAAANFVIIGVGSGTTAKSYPIPNDGLYHTNGFVAEVSGTGNKELVSKMGIEIIFANATEAATCKFELDGTNGRGIIGIDMGYSTKNPYFNYTAEQMSKLFPDFIYAFGFRSGEADFGDLITWANGSDVFVITYYDQKATYDFVQTVTSKQPQIGFGGFIIDALYFHGSMQMTAPSTLLNGLIQFTIAMVYKSMDFSGGSHRLISLGNSSTEPNGTPACFLQQSDDMTVYFAGNNVVCQDIQDEYFNELMAVQTDQAIIAIFNDQIKSYKVITTPTTISTTYQVRLSGSIDSEYWYGYVKSLAFYDLTLSKQQQALINNAAKQDPATEPLATVSSGAILALGLTQLNPAPVSKTMDGENLCRDAEKLRDVRAYPLGRYTFDTDFNFRRMYITNGSTHATELLSNNSISITAGQYYTVSFIYRTDAAGLVLSYNFHNPGVSTIAVSPTITALGDGTYRAVATAQLNFSRLRLPDIGITFTTGSYFDIKEFKLEQSSSRNLWCPNSADIVSPIMIQRKDGTRLNVPLKNGNVDFEAIESFCDGDEARVCRIWDQSGYCNHAYQDTWINMPSIYDQRMLGGIRFNGIRFNQAVTNGNFASGTSNWSAYHLSISVGTDYVTLTNTGTSWTPFMDYVTIANPSSTSYKFVYLCKVRWVSGNPPTRIRIWGDSDTSIAAYINNPVQNQWYTLCGVQNITTVGGSLRPAICADYASSALASGGTWQIDRSVGYMCFNVGTQSNYMYNRPASFWAGLLTSFVSGAQIGYRSYMQIRNSASMAELNSMSLLMSFDPETESQIDFARYLTKKATDGQMNINGWEVNRNGLTDRGDFRIDLISPARVNTCAYQSNVFDAGHILLYTLNRTGNILKCYKDWKKIIQTYASDTSGLNNNGDYWDIGTGNLANSYPLIIGGIDNPGSMNLSAFILYNRAITDDERVILQTANF